MKNIEIIVAHNYNPFDKEHPFFFEIFINKEFQNNGSGSFKGVGLINLILDSSNKAISSFQYEDTDEISIYFNENDFKIYKLNKMINEVKSVEDYNPCGVLADFIKLKENIFIKSTEKNILNETLLNNLFSRHF